MLTIDFKSYLNFTKIFFGVVIDTFKNSLRLPSYRPWGIYETLIDFPENNVKNDDNGYKIKRIIVNPGKRLSLQSHDYRSEHWIIVKGTAKVQVGDDDLIMKNNQHIYIPKNCKHRIENIGEDDLVFIEVQLGNYLGEDDITRYQDDFGRS